MGIQITPDGKFSISKHGRLIFSPAGFPCCCGCAAWGASGEAGDLKCGDGGTTGAIPGWFTLEFDDVTIDTSCRRSPTTPIYPADGTGNYYSYKIEPGTKLSGDTFAGSFCLKDGNLVHLERGPSGEWGYTDIYPYGGGTTADAGLLITLYLNDCSSGPILASYAGLAVYMFAEFDDMGVATQMFTVLVVDNTVGNLKYFKAEHIPYPDHNCYTMSGPITANNDYSTSDWDVTNDIRGAGGTVTITACCSADDEELP